MPCGSTCNPSRRFPATATSDWHIIEQTRRDAVVSAGQPRRPPRGAHRRDRPWLEERRARCAGGLWAAQDALQSLRALGGQRRLHGCLSCAGLGWWPAGRATDRFIGGHSIIKAATIIPRTNFVLQQPARAYEPRCAVLTPSWTQLPFRCIDLARTASSAE